MDNLNDADKEPVQNNYYLLVLAILMSLLNRYLSGILAYICVTTNKLFSSTHINELKEQLSTLQIESSQMDMTNDFASYARLQRKIIKVKEELKKEVNQQTESDMKKKLKLRLLVGLVGIVVVYCYNSHPVVWLPPDWLYPVTSLLAWPGFEPGSISFLVWCAITNSVVRTLS